MKVSSMIISPVFSELVIIIGTDAVVRLLSEIRLLLFETLRTVSRTRPFEVVFLLMELYFSLGEAQWRLTEALDSVAARGLPDFPDSPPTICSGRYCEQWWNTSFD